MISVETAKERILESLQPLPAESVPLEAAVGRGCAHDVIAPSDLPEFDNAGVDGFAVQSTDLQDASKDQPVTLRMVDVISAGSAPSAVIRAGTCARVFTGAVLPAGADAVVMQEDTVITEPASVLFRDRVRPWEGVRLAGGDVRRGSRLVGAGQRLRPAHIGLLAAAGHAAILVHRRPRITVVTTGNELLEPGEPRAPGQIYNSNRVLLASLAASDGLEVLSAPRIPDTLEHTMAGILEASRASDVVITTGGVSVGEADLVKAALAALGGRVEHWRVAMKPGKPFAWGRLENALWFGLPGNPVSTFVTWWVLVRPALLRLMGMKLVDGRRVQGRLAGPVSNRGDRRHYLRVTLDPAGLVAAVGAQASHVQSGLAAADALLDVPPRTTWEAGRDVQVELLP